MKATIDPLKMSRSQRIRAHRRLWRWCKAHPELEKDNWPEWEWNEGRYLHTLNLCFLCVDCCEDCALEWPISDGCMTRGEKFGLFTLWTNCKNLRKRANLAKQIAELPVRRIKKIKK